MDRNVNLVTKYYKASSKHYITTHVFTLAFAISAFWKKTMFRNRNVKIKNKNLF